jgi:cytochrome c peroxidase
MMRGARWIALGGCLVACVSDETQPALAGRKDGGPSDSAPDSSEASELDAELDGPDAATETPKTDASAGEAGTDESALRALLHVPDRFPLPAIPDVNPATPEKVALGRRLFYDQRLSFNSTTSCASCHKQELAFADGVAHPAGATGALNPRNSPGLQNVAYFASLTWASRSLVRLEDQIQVPVKGDRPIELGVSEANRDQVLARFANDPDYAGLFEQAFPASPSGPNIDKIVFALATFVRTMNSADSPFDRYRAGDASALTRQQLDGLALFQGEELECFHCHTGTNMTVSYADARTTAETATYPFFNNGLYNVDDSGSYPAIDQGLYQDTLNPVHRGKFRPSSLRNIVLTGPYMHDGSKADLNAVLDHYAAGGTLTTEGTNAGDGRKSSLKSALVAGFGLTEEDRAALVAFFQSLTDETFLHREDLSSPF